MKTKLKTFIGKFRDEIIGITFILSSLSFVLIIGGILLGNLQRVDIAENQTTMLVNDSIAKDQIQDLEKKIENANKLNDLVQKK